VDTLTKLASSDFADLFRASNLEELVAVMANLENGIRGWLLINPKGGRRPTLIAGNELTPLDAMAVEGMTLIDFPDRDQPCGKNEPWAASMLAILDGHGSMISKTELLVPILSRGRLLAIAGLSGSPRKLGIAAKNVNHAVRKLHEMDGLRQDLAGLKFLGIHSATPIVLVTGTGRIMDGTNGGLAILAEVKPKDSSKEIGLVISPALRRTIAHDGEEVILGGYKARISHPPLFRVITTAEPLIKVTFFRTIHHKALEHAQENLTPAQQRVHVHLMAGDRNKEIADKLKISEHTVRHHVSAVLRKFNCSDRLLLLARAAEAPHAETPFSPTRAKHSNSQSM
jgi:DNA-binding CsgD family transcriptional regulator